MAKRQDPKRAEQARKCYELALLGYSQRQIAEKVGISQTTVHNRIGEQIAKRVHPKADEYRAQQIDRCGVYLRSLATQVLAGDAKAINNALRVEERIAKLMGTDSATLFKVEATAVSRESDANEAQRLLDQYFGNNNQQNNAEPKFIPHVDVTSRPRRPTRPLSGAAATNADHTPPDEFAEDADVFQPHEVQREAVRIAHDVEPPRRRRSRNIEVSPE